MEVRVALSEAGVGKVASTHFPARTAGSQLMEKPCALAVGPAVALMSSEWVIAWKECVSCPAKLAEFTLL